MNKKTLILTATHGDEDFSIPVVKKLAKRFKFDWLVSNPRAYKQQVRFVEADLNRSGPGNSKSPYYEVRRAKTLIKLASQYDQVIDIHGTTSNSGLFVILSDPNWQNIELAKKIDLENVVMWPSLQPKGPLTQFIPNSLEIECGPKNSPQIAKDLEKTLTDFFYGKPITKQQQFFIVSGQLPKSVIQPMKDFEPTKYKKQAFTPLLVDQYPNLKCYCLQPVQNTLSFINTKE